MINLANIVLDKDLGAQEFFIHRQSGVWVNGIFILDPVLKIKALANIQPATSKELEQLPEGDREKGVLIFRTVENILTTSNQELPNTSFVSDELEWHRNKYKVLRIDEWSDYGYFEAYASLVGDA